MYSKYTPNLKKSSSTKIRVSGRGVVGKVVGDEYRKRGTNAHILRTPPAIANDIQALYEAERAGAMYCVFTNTETGIVYRAPIAKIWEMGFKFNRGFGDQIGLALSHWHQTCKPGHKETAHADAPEYADPSDTGEVKPLRYESRAAVGVKFERGKQLSLFGGG